MGEVEEAGHVGLPVTPSICDQPGDSGSENKTKNRYQLVTCILMRLQSVGDLELGDRGSSVLGLTYEMLNLG